MSNIFKTNRQIDGMYNHKIMVFGMIVPVTNERHVVITQDGGSLRMQFSMTPEQARQLSEALLDSAYEVDEQKEAA